MRGIALFLVTVAALLAGCGNAGDVVGTWTQPEQHLTVQFKPDQTFTQTSKHGPLSATVSGHYTFGGNHLVLKIENATVGDGTKKGDAAAESSVQKMIGTNDESDIEFLTPDRINVKRGVRIDTFDRVKSP